MDNIISLILAILIIIICIGLGRKVLSFFGWLPSRELEIYILSFLFGHSLICYIIFFIGVSAGYTKSIIWSVLFFLLIASFFILKTGFLYRLIDFLIESFKNFIKIKNNSYILLLLSISIIIVSIMNFVAAFAPPTDADSLSYHLAIPKYFIDFEKIIFQPFYMSWGIPLHSEMFNLLGLILGYEIFPQIINWLMGIISAITLYILTSEIFSKRAGFFAAVFYYLTPKIIFLSSTSKSDLTLFSYIFLSMFYMIVWSSKKENKTLWLSAVFTGLALATKYQGFHWGLSIGLFLIILNFKDLKQLSIKTIKIPLVYGLISFLIASPWYIKNFILTGDPIWPFGFSIFNSQYWTQNLHDKYLSWQQGPGDSIWHYFMGLWNLSLNQSSWIGGLRIPYLPIQLSLAPIIPFYWSRLKNKEKKILKFLAIPFFVYYTFWFTGYQQSRYVLPIMSLLLIPSSYIFWELIKLRFSKFIGYFLMVIILLFSISYSFVFNSKSFPVVAKIETRNEYLNKRVSYFADMQWVNQNLDEDSKILFCNLKPFYLDHDYLILAPNIFLHDINQMNENEFYNFLKNQKITHIFLPFEMLNASEYAKFKILIDSALSQKNIEEIYFNNKSKLIESRTLGTYKYVPLSIFIVK